MGEWDIIDLLYSNKGEWMDGNAIQAKLGGNRGTLNTSLKRARRGDLVVCKRLAGKKKRYVYKAK